MVLSARARRLVAAIQDGLPLTPRPYATVAAAIGVTEDEVIQRLDVLQRKGVISRLGVIVSHRELGYRANGMVVWDVPDAEVDQVGRRLGSVDCVRLCYQRPRQPPDWPYNLFCMIHGQDREAVLASLAGIVQDLELEDIPHRVLFSVRRFKQRGARYVDAPAAGASHG